MSASSPRAPLGSNPFVVGPPVYGKGPFFGRAEEIKALGKGLRTSGLMRLTGEPQIGKSSLLRHLEEVGLAGFVPVYVEACAYRPGAEAPLAALARDLLRPLGADLPEGLSEEPVDWAGQLYKVVGPKVKRRKLLLLVDQEPQPPEAEVLEALVALVGAGARTASAAGGAVVVWVADTEAR